MAAPWIVDDGLWDLVAPLLPPWPTRAPGPQPVDDRRCLQPILFVLHTGIGWQDLPQQVGFGSEMTCRRRLRRWTDVGIFDQLHRILLTAALSPVPPAPGFDVRAVREVLVAGHAPTPDRVAKKVSN